MKLQTLLMLFLFTASYSAIAQTRVPTPTDDCETLANMQQMRGCAQERMELSEEMLLAVYQKLEGDIDPGLRLSLKNSQSKWLEMRDEDCEIFPSKDGFSYYRCMALNNILRGRIIVAHYEELHGKSPVIPEMQKYEEGKAEDQPVKPHPDMAACSETEAIEAMIKRIQEGSPGATQGIRYVRIVDIEPYARDGESITCRFSAWVNAGGKIPMTLKQILADGEPMGLLEPIWDEIDMD